MKEQNSIPTSKIKRAAKILGTGAKVGGNYVKYYSKKIVNPDLSRDELHADNAEDIYNSLAELKGSALKVAQMMSMDSTVLPTAYQKQFSMAQYNAPSLSFPLISKTFKTYFGKSPGELFEDFSKNAVHAASIGQVHSAILDGKKLAVKIQYPGVADAIESDLRLVKPLAARLFNMKASEMDNYMDEVASKLLEETDYLLELNRSQAIAQGCKDLQNVRFPKYYPELSTQRILTMDWLDGQMFPDFIASNPSQEVRDKIGQAMWDFFMYQIKFLRMVHADPHPGNFIVNEHQELCVLDFGCVKEIPQDFFDNYFRLLNKSILEDESGLLDLYIKLEFYKPEDTPKERALLDTMYRQMIGLLGKPFHGATFDFGDDEFFKKIYAMGESFGTNKDLRKMNNARGSKHTLYVMRTFFGLYSLLNQLKANIEIRYNIAQ